jgi:menaquinone-dependent protoporphyrinogen oxidase
MERALVLYATKEGHTRRIAYRVGQALRARGVVPTVVDVKNVAESIRLGDYGSAVLLASVHAGHHEREMLAFVKRHRAALTEMRAAFISVNLSEAGVEDSKRTASERAAAQVDVKGLLDTFTEETGWAPSVVKPVAGALLYTRYNPFLRFVMKRITKKAGGPTDTTQDYEFTDWQAIDRFVAEFVGSVEASRAAAPSAR